MAALRETATAIARGAAPTVLISDRLLALERLVARLANRRRRHVPRAAASGRSADRAAITAYLLGDPADAARRSAAAQAAARHDWAWRLRGEHWRLWDGPETLAAALRDAADPAAVLRDAGLVGRLATGGFAAAAQSKQENRIIR